MIPLSDQPNVNTTSQNPEHTVDLQQAVGMLWAARNYILIITLIVLLFGAFRVVTATRIYEANAVVQVEDENKSIADTLAGGDLGAFLGSPMKTEAEIEILQSRMVLDRVIDDFKMTVTAGPKYFPLIGATIARHHKAADGLAPAFLGLSSYAWGGEKIDVTTLEVPPELVDKALRLRATGSDGFTLADNKGEHLLDGRVGETVDAQTPKGPVRMFVRDLVARPGTQFTVAHLSHQLVLEDLQARMVVAERGKKSGIIGIRFRGSSVQDVTDIVNHIANAYLRQNVERRSAEAQQSLEFLQKQLPELKGRVDAAQQALNAYQMKKGSVDISSETQVVLQQGVELETRRLQLVQQRQEALQRFTSQHPVVLALNSQIAEIDRQQSELKKRTSDLPQTQQEILSLQEDLEVNNQLYTALLNSAQQLQVAKAGTTGNVRVIEYALPPIGPIQPRVALTLTMSLLLGLMLGCGSVVLRSVLLKGVDKPDEVERALGLPTYAAIPFSPEQGRLTRTMARESKGDFILARTAGYNSAVEAIRSLRTSLHFALLEARNNILMLTGPTPGLGKSFITVNLGAVLVQGGKKVVIIDGDLRRGHLNQYFGAPAVPGISDYVAGDADEASIVRNGGMEGLDFVTNGTTPPNPSELLMHERFSTLMHNLAARYDYVLIDTPPVLLVTDAAVVGRLAGSTLMVLKSGEHVMRAIEESARRLRQAGVELKGTIFNQVGGRMGSYGYYGGKYGYDADYRSNYRSSERG